MNKIDVIRAWRDPEYRASLRADEVPSHPAGLVELTDVKFPLRMNTLDFVRLSLLGQTV